MQRLDLLGTLSEEPGRLTRPYASAAMQRAIEMVGRWMRHAGMAVRRDNIGNLRARYEGHPGSDATLLLGSHLDSVRDAGKFDGPLGVVVAVAAVQRLHDQGKRLPFAIEVLGFADEEGLRFGSTYLGSRALAGGLEPADLDRTDGDGITLREAIRAFGGDPERIDEDRWSGGRPLGYCEVHIEQGPVLEARNLAVGVVSAVAGQTRRRLTFRGEAAHAGTTPMDRRRDALTAAAEFVLAAEREALAHPGLVATVGQLAISPAALNVVPAEARLSLDVRHVDDGIRSASSQRLLELAEGISKRRHVDLESEQLVDSRSIACAPQLTALLVRSIEELGHSACQLASGAGHDAVAMSALTDVAMLFVRCKGGISHNPAESVSTADVGVAIDVLERFLDALAAGAST